MIRIGHGYDVHAFGEGDHVMLGGVRIEHSRGLIAHSDGDVVIHALCDALLGAMALGDIGHFFPDDDPEFKGADSRELLSAVMRQLRDRDVRVNNADMTVIAQKPKLAPHIVSMRERIAETMDIAVDCVSVKATTSEKLGFTGREEGIAAHASVLVESL
ncbi:2C-methyl-D-erythritol 2,4-cyclodiphosphate synthase [gamma proteobacterium HTCC5015]|nr:2C-methyl-D-erythritol 2,4-cyclodiphosphate synthase [gamma proteobacterium HTCC5015]